MKKFLASLSLVLIVMLVLAGCESDENAAVSAVGYQDIVGEPAEIGETDENDDYQDIMNLPAEVDEDNGYQDIIDEPILVTTEDGYQGIMSLPAEIDDDE